MQYSMSDMKHDAIVNSGISIGNRHDLPAELIPPDSQVEIQGGSKDHVEIPGRPGNLLH